VIFVLCTLNSIGSASPYQPACNNVFSCHVDFEPMYADAQRQERREDVLSSLNMAIESLNLAKELSSITPAKTVFSSAGIILTMIRVDFFLLRLR
jgi:hypothetical protein